MSCEESPVPLDFIWFTCRFRRRSQG